MRMPPQEWVQAMASVRRCPVAQRADSQLQSPNVSKAPLDDVT